MFRALLRVDLASMGTSYQESSTKSDILLQTRFPSDEFTIKWKIPGFFQALDDINFDFASKTTRWRLKLNKTDEDISIKLHSREQEPVKVTCTVLLKTIPAVFQQKTDYTVLDSRHTNVEILNLNTNVYSIRHRKGPSFAGGVFELDCTIKVIGPAFNTCD